MGFSGKSYCHVTRYWPLIAIGIQMHPLACIRMSYEAIEKDKLTILMNTYRTSQIAVDAPELLDYFQWKSNVHLVGISMGGMISLEMAYAEPTRFQSLTLTSPTARRNLLTVRFLCSD